MTEEVFEIVRAAVTLARNHSVRHLATLKRMLLDKYPGKGAEVDEAIKYWANHVARDM